MAIDRAQKLFRNAFGAGPHWIATAPGRVNLLGEHVDYNGGIVLPMGIERTTIVAISPNPNSRSVRAVSGDLNERVHFEVDERRPPANKPWWSYIAGVIAQFDAIRRKSVAESPKAVTGLDIAIVSDVPIGSGLSSSAALSVATATVLNELLGTALTPIELAKLCQAAEHEFAGVPCGLMDPLCVAACQAGHALWLDCQSESYRQIPLDDPKISILISDTRAMRKLAEGTYAQRRRECESVARACGARSLRELSIARLEQAKIELPAIEYRRAKHVVEEMARVQAATNLIEQKQWGEFGRLMNASHESLRDLFEVSCPELDVMVEIAQGLNGVLGSRMTGAGFGGCTVSLVETRVADQVLRQLAAEYRQRTNLEPELLYTRAGGGARIVQRK